MACWVVPSIAADIWGVSVDHIMDCIARRTVDFKEDSGFLVVDVAPNDNTLSHQPARYVPPPPSFIPLSDDELDALSEALEPSDKPLEREPGDVFCENEILTKDELSALEVGVPAWIAQRKRATLKRLAPRPEFTAA